MAFNHQEYNETYLENVRAGNEAINDAAKNYGVTIEPAEVKPGEKYWKVIGVHHLLPLENWSNHHVYLEVLDENGNRARNPVGWVGWTWENRQPHEPARPVVIDKPDNEPGGNIAVDKNQLVSVWMQGRAPDANDKSDKVVGIRITHPDEPLPDGALHNTWGHHSFYVVFQQTTKKADAQRTNSVISGRLIDGAGQTLRLLRQNTLIKEIKLDAGTAFRFENLGPGIYTLEVKGVPVKRGNLQLDGQNSIEVNLAMPAPQASVIRGAVTDGLGHTIILGKGSAVINRQTLPPDGTFRFKNLPAGVYNLAIWNKPVRADNIEVDGKSSQVVNLKIAEQAPEADKRIDHYVLLGPPQARGRRANFFIALDYLLHFSLPAGFSVETAKLARRVTVIGEGITSSQIKTIRQSGSEVEHLAGTSYELEDILTQRIKTNQAFGT
jgi:hypothetical protein